MVAPSDVTVVVPTRNEARNIGTFLRSLPPFVHLVAVDSSDDATPQLVERLRPWRTTVLRQRVGVTAARQLGAAAVRTPWMLITDADVYFDVDYLERLAAYGAAPVIYGPKTSRADFARYHRWFCRGQRWLHAVGVPAASGSNLLIRTDVFWSLGGFDLRLPCNEDSELVWRAHRAGYRVQLARDLIVYSIDDRRLQRGVTHKAVHSALRCALLFSGLMPDAWRRSDWGYWEERSAKPDAVVDLGHTDGARSGSEGRPPQTGGPYAGKSPHSGRYQWAED